MGAISNIAKKYRRALRNETGAKFTLDELRALVDIGTLDTIIQAEAEEIKGSWARTHHLTSSATTGSTSAATVAAPISGKSPDMTPRQDRTYIAALSAKH